MKLTHITSLILLALPTLAQASHPDYTIEITGVTGTGCPDASAIKTVYNEVTGEYYIDAKFNQAGDVFFAETLDRPTERVGCTVSYNLKLADDKMLDLAQFNIDGQYNLSENGTAFFSIRHNVPGFGSPTYHNVSYSSRNGDLPDDNFQLSGSIEGIDQRVNVCGGTIPLEVQIRATARSGRNDGLTTFVAVDNATGDIYAREGYRRISCKPYIVPCS